MKTSALTCLAGLALATAATAGTGTYTDSSRVTSSGASGSLWQWFVGGSAGYLIDEEEPMYHLQLGVEFRNPATVGFHSVFLEVGFSQADSDFYDVRNDNYAALDVDIIPLTLNYKYEAAFTDRLNFYIGAGIGVAFTDVSFRWNLDQFEGSDDSSDTLLYGQIFTGLSYNVSQNFAVFGGVRYVMMENERHSVDLTDLGSYDAGIDGDVLIEVGARYRF